MEQDCLDTVLTLKEAARAWALQEDALRRACQRGQFGASEARKSGGTWLITREALEEKYGPPGEHRATGGVAVTDLMPVYGLKRQTDVLSRRDEFPAGLLWKSGRRWMTTRDAMDRVFGGRH